MTDQDVEDIRRNAETMWRAGSSAKNRPANTETAAVNARAVPSMTIASSLGMPGGALVDLG